MAQAGASLVASASFLLPPFCSFRAFAPRGQENGPRPSASLREDYRDLRSYVIRRGFVHMMAN